MKKIFILGSLNMDLVVSAPTIPASGETLTGSSFFMNPGGKGANQAVAVSKSGGDALMVGSVGTEFGQDLVTTLQGYNVDTRFVKTNNKISSGVALIILSNSDNRIIVDPGANGLVDAKLVNSALAEASKGDYLLSQLEVPLSTISYAFKKAKKLGMITCLNVAPVKPLPKTIYSAIDYFCANQIEAEFYTGIKPDMNGATMKAGKALLEMGVKSVLITLGVHGSLFINERETIRMNSYQVDSLDTTAAGDTFIGSFFARLADGATHQKAMEFASGASALCITRLGAQQSIPTREETESFLRSKPCKRN